MNGSNVLEKILHGSKRFVQGREVMLKGAVYSLSTGEVTILEEEG